MHYIAALNWPKVCSPEAGSYMRAFWLFTAIFAVVLLAGFDTLNRTLSGVVTDRNAKPIPHAAVQLENERTLAVRSYLTDEHGEFHFAELSPDIDYDVRAEFDGIRSKTRVVSQFDGHKAARIRLVIEISR